METDLILVKRFADHGDEDAFSEIISRYADLVYSACLRILGEPGQASDAAPHDRYFHPLTLHAFSWGAVGSLRFARATSDDQAGS